MWERYSGSPEIFNTQSRVAESLAWPLRPELVESTYMLYRATKDDSYLSFGERVIYDIANRTKVPCGLAAIENVENGAQQDRMHSFVLAETLPVSSTCPFPFPDCFRRLMYGVVSLFAFRRTQSDQSWVKQ